MLKMLSQAAGFGLSMMVLVDTAHSVPMYPDQCYPNCDQYYEDLQCVGWFGSGWWYCGWNNGWTYCCGGE